MFLDTIKRRLKEASTWKGIISALVTLGVFTLTETQSEALAGVAVSIYIALSVFLPDRFDG